MIALVDYGAGNLTSVVKAFAHLGGEVTIARDPAVLAGAAAIVVPGVGHFGATAALEGRWKRGIEEHVSAGRPLLGICLGMQWLYESSTEAPDVRGLGVVRGTCERLPENRVKVPHVGWNELTLVGRSPLLEHVRAGDQVYFTHSFAAPITPETVATTEHGTRFASVVQSGRVLGVQFHPEKSGEAGLQVLRNFLRAL